MRQLVSLVLALLVALPSPAATFFVDMNPAVGNDSNNGTSMATPWRRTPGDPAATGNAASTLLAPGDTVKFKGGTGFNYTNRFTLNRSGTSGNLITYDGKSWTGTNTVLDRLFIPDTSCIGSSGARSWFHITGFDMQHAGGYPYNSAVFSGATGSILNGPYGGAISFPHTCTDYLITYCRFREIGHFTNVIQNFDYNSFSGVVIFTKANKRGTIAFCEFEKFDVGIQLLGGSKLTEGGSATEYTDGMTIISNDFSGGYFRWAIDITAQATGQGLSNITIAHNKIANYWQYGEGNWKGGNPSGNPHTDGIIGRNGTAGKWGNIRIHSNHFYFDERGPSGEGGGTAHIFFTEGGQGGTPGLLIYNNLFTGRGHPNEILIGFPTHGGVQQRVGIFNNTFNDVISAVRFNGETNPVLRRVDMANNVLRLSGNVNNYMLWLQTHNHQTNTIRTFDYNVYTNRTTSPGSWWAMSRPTDTTMNFSDIRNLNGYEANGFVGDPLFIDPDQLADSVNLRPATNSPINFVGTNLTSLFTTDYHGSNRPSSGPWTIGAIIPSATAEEPDPGDTDPPVPDPLTWVINPVAISQSSIFMSWATATDAESEPVTYTVEEFSGNPGCSSFQTTATEYTDTGIAPSTTCRYRVFATDAVGNSGDATAVGDGDATTFQPPTADLIVTTFLADTLTVTEPPAENLFLDEAGDEVFVTWSTRRMQLSYGGPMLRVQRSSDLAEQDIPFNEDFDGDIDALTNFVGAAYGRVTIFYGQEGDINLSTSVTNQMPLVVSNGVPILSPTGKLMVRFDGVDDRLIGPAQTKDIPFSGMLVVRAREQDNIGWIGGANSSARVNTLLLTNRFGIQSGVALPSEVIATNTMYQVHWSVVSGTSDSITISTNTPTVGSAGDFGFSNTQVVMGSTTAGAPVDIAELTIWPVTLSEENLTRYRNNQRTYYGLP